MFNPFPGLRPFEADEDHLFFGREKQIDELLRRLRSTRFLSVIGTSGSGKSSLVRSGLIPSLYSGFMVSAGSSWRVATLRPGEDPIGHLAAALNAHEVLGTDEAELGATNQILIDATLRRGALGLVDAVRQARIPHDDNVLVIVDQFEELFRFRHSRQVEHSRDEAIAFVKLLLEATSQNAVPIYVVLTMRSDFIGDCMEYPGLAEAVNDGQYLVPRMNREELRSAITGPVAVGGGQIAPRFVLRLLNDLADDHDQLPVLQHALMRTWDHWETRRQDGLPIDIADYEAIGTLREALSRHAEEAYREAGSLERGAPIAERLFKALTDTFSDQRGVRRPTSVQALAGICEATEAEVIEVVEIFRRPGRSFLMPPHTMTLRPRSIIDLAHESLMRNWTRLIEWAEEERAAAGFYVRLSQAAAWFEEGTAGLWRNPELELGLRWKRDNQPTAAWANRYDGTFERAMAFLDRSEVARARAEADEARERKRKLRHAQSAAAIFGVLFLAAGLLAYLAWKENARAERNLGLAREAVDQTLSSADSDPARFGADVPEMEAFRKELLIKAKRFYADFVKQDSANEDIRKEMALAHFRLGHISRMLENADEAAKEYRESIAQFQRLEEEYSRPPYRQALANAHNWLGETLRSSPAHLSDAEQAYNTALGLQRDLARASPEDTQYRQELARSYYNRGILRSITATPNDPQFRQADADFREAITLLEPLAAQRADRVVTLELARAYNNLASLLALAEDEALVAEAKTLYERAIQIDEALTRAEPANREYKLELAKFCNNLADVLRALGQPDAAKARNEQALDLLDELARPAPSLAIEQADAHNLRGRILAPKEPRAAQAEYEKALSLFSKVPAGQGSRSLAAFHLRFGDLLLNLAVLSGDTADIQGVRRLLGEAIAHYLALANRSLASGAVADAQAADENLSRLLPELSERDRAGIIKAYQELHERITTRK